MDENNAASEEELMRLTAGGDNEAFAAIVEKHHAQVYAFAFRLLGSASEAEEAAQETFIKAYAAAAGYRPSARFTTWLLTITRNLCLNRLEKLKRTPLSVPVESTSGDDESPARQFEDKTDIPPLEMCILEERKNAVRQALDSLPPNQKTAVILCRFEEMSYQEAAAVMGLTEKAVKSLMHRARINLAEKLAPLIEEKPEQKAELSEKGTV